MANQENRPPGKENDQKQSAPFKFKMPDKLNFNYTAYFLLALVALLIAVILFSRVWFFSAIALVGAVVLAYYGYRDYQGKNK